MHNSKRFTIEQVLAGIQTFVRHELGETWTVDPDLSVLDYERRVTDACECPLLFLESLAEYFDFS